MFEVTAREDAARIASWTPDTGPRIDVPCAMWPADELGPDQHEWAPTMDTKSGQLINTFSIQNDETVAGASAGSLLVRRRLEAATIMPRPDAGLRFVQRLAVLTGAINLQRNPKRLASALVAARREAGFARLLYAPGLGAPADAALMVWAGIDVLDGLECSMAAARGQFLSIDGGFDAAVLDEAECPCNACQGRAPAAMDEESLRRHNQQTLSDELARIRNAIRGGRLRTLVESRVRSDPERTALLRRFDAQHEAFDPFVPVASTRNVLANSHESLTRPDVRRFRRRVEQRHRPDPDAAVLLLLPCSARKPYTRSKSHRRFHDATWRSGAASRTEQWIVTSPLGVVPRALERTYPAANYDVPVTGQWDAEEGVMIRTALSALLAKRSWETVVAHVPESTYRLIEAALPSAHQWSCPSGNPTSNENLARLETALAKAAGQGPRPSISAQLGQRMLQVAEYQFGVAAADALFAGTTVRGKWPGGRLLAGSEQLASFPIDKGLLSLTLPGAQRILDAGVMRVAIEDFTPRGSVFAVGVTDADVSIRIGDEVVLHHDGKIKGVGVARMSGAEMVALDRGVAVGVRHHA